MRFETLSAFLLAALTLEVAGTPVDAANSDATPFSVLTVAEMKHWLATTDANLTFIGDVSALGVSPFVTTVTYCSTRTANLCSGPCTVYTGGATCLNAPNTNCLSATSNVAFCDQTNCKGTPCNVFDSCGTRLDNGFCYTPGTKSISVPP
ncbi:hypothetical protein DFH08DRAFT_977400 [Mycena albidolilacea]|uniref:Uncharacterized protein n=1 Tax=Mycena albidolilacea TaxID=1033008 RepID=A0AAD6Z0Y9_9AGAR|nr:hypothetical protein DFH08DRAFT_977399 [Mycena albidolilacea]KAJ7303024.1 hypothetical protein DFH08DRAFT_977400 [Mycena albidolilacea]